MAFRFGSIAAGLTVCGALVVLIGGTFLIMLVTVNGLLYHDIESTSRKLAKQVTENVADLRQVAAGAEPSPESKMFFAKIRHSGDIFRFKIFDAAGKLRLTSDDLAATPETDQALGQHNPLASEVVKTGDALIEVEEGIPPKRPARYAEAYVPVIVEGQTIAILEAYVDQTEKSSVFQGYFLTATLWLAALVTVAFSFPAWGFYRRTLQKQAADQRVSFLAHHDSLTHLANRAWFLENLQDALTKTEMSGTSIAVHYLDLDRFKQINDTLGHATGDELLKVFADRLGSIVRPDDLISRLGGDEFAIAQLSLTDRADAATLADRLLQALAKPFIVGERAITMTSSVGTAVSPGDGTNPLRLLKSADLALYAAKGQGRARRCFFEAGMDAELEKRLKLERLVREAAVKEGFELYFQPLQDSAAQRICGFEALLRLRQADGTFIPPDQFIPVAEDIGVISTIGTWVIRKACRVAAEWPEHLTIAVNLSAAQFKDGRLVGVVREALAESGLAAERLELEITEGLLLADTEPTLQQLAELKSLGVGIVMDDFGTGYSSLSYLWKFPFNKIKVDRSFMSAFAANQGVGSILRTIVALGHSMNVPVTAEGVETEAQANFLYEIACDHLQGFHLGRPMPEAEVAGTILRDFEHSIRTAEPGALGLESSREAEG